MVYAFLSKIVKTVDIALLGNIYDISSREILNQALALLKEFYQNLVTQEQANREISVLLKIPH